MRHLLGSLLKHPIALTRFIVASSVVVLGTPLLAIIILVTGVWHG